jgi:hypothetical protein
MLLSSLADKLRIGSYCSLSKPCKSYLIRFQIFLPFTQLDQKQKLFFLLKLLNLTPIIYL